MTRLNNERLLQIESLQLSNSENRAWPSSLILELLQEVQLLRGEKKKLQRKFDSLVSKIKRIQTLSQVGETQNETALGQS